MRNPIFALRVWLRGRNQHVRHCVKYMLSHFCWGRRLLGGHWEEWWIGAPVHSWMWLDVPVCAHHSGARPPLGELLSHCETWAQAHVLENGGLAERTGSGRYRIVTAGPDERIVKLEKQSGNK